MSHQEMLDNVRHRTLRVNKQYRPGLGYDVNVARVYPAEFGRLQSEYPLFFVKNTETGDFDAVALLGFGNHENLYLGEAGWAARQIPLSIERQPLLVGFQERDVDGVPTQVPVVHIDLDHPAVSENEGEPLFLPEGGESPWLERMTGVLMAIHQGLAASRALSRMLVGLELIESLALEVTFRDESKHTLNGLFTINEEKLAGLSAQGLEALHRDGHLKHLYMVLASLPNLEALVERKNQRLAA